MFKYKCPECDKLFSGKEWDKQTKLHYEDDCIMSIEHDRFGSVFNCPNCDAENDGEAIEAYEEETVAITRKEYEQLLGYKAICNGLCE